MQQNSTSDINTLAFRSLYPAANGVTLAQAGTAGTPSNTSELDSVVPASTAIIPLHNALNIGLAGNPLSYWLALTIFLFVGMWAATRFAGAGQTANIRFSLYNVLAILILGIVGGSIAKVFVTKFPIPGITPVVLAS